MCRTSRARCTSLRWWRIWRACSTLSRASWTCRAGERKRSQIYMEMLTRRIVRRHNLQSSVFPDWKRLRRRTGQWRWRSRTWSRRWRMRSLRPKWRLTGCVTCERALNANSAGWNTPKRSWYRWGRPWTPLTSRFSSSETLSKGIINVEECIPYCSWETLKVSFLLQKRT